MSDALAQSKLGKKKRFVRSSEQTKFLNNRDKDVRAEEKSDNDGSSNAPLQGNQEEEIQKEQQDTSKKEATPRAPKTPNHVDETIAHELKDYYNLPEGACFMKRKGEIDLCYYTVFEYQPVKIIKHVYEIARVQLLTVPLNRLWNAHMSWNVVHLVPGCLQKCCHGNMYITCP